MRGRYIVFEGSEGAGKEHQKALLIEKLQARGIEVIPARDPGTTQFGEQIRRELHSSDNTSASTQFLSASSARADLIEHISGWLEQGKWVVCNRNWLSSYVIYGTIMGVDLNFIKQTTSKALQGVEPDATIILDINTDSAYKRKLNSYSPTEDTPNKKPTIKYLNRVKDGYLKAAKTFGYPVVNMNDGSKEAEKQIDLIIQRMEEEPTPECRLLPVAEQSSKATKQSQVSPSPEIEGGTEKMKSQKESNRNNRPIDISSTSTEPNSFEYYDRGIFGDSPASDRRHIKDYGNLSDYINTLKALGTKIVLVSGTFDMLHIGHARYLEAARNHGDFMVVGVDSDTKVKNRKGPSRPLVPENERIQLLTHIRGVGFVALKTPQHRKWELIKTVKPDTLIATEETYTDEQIEILEKNYCGRVVKLPRQAETSTSARIRHFQMNANGDVAQKALDALRDVLGPLVDEKNDR